MEEFMQLGDVWAQTFDVSHFDDLKVTEAKDGLNGFSFKPKPQVDVQVDLLEDLLDSPVGGYLGLEWMEQPTVSQYLPVPVADDGPVIGESITDLLDDNLSFDTATLVLEDKKPEQSTASVEFLQNLIQQQEEMMGLVKVKVESPVSSAPSSPEAQVAPEIDFSVTGTVALEDVFDSANVEFIQAPLSPEDVESLLSSSPSPSTIDTSSLYSEDGSLICNSSDLYEVVSNDGQTSRGSPYSRPRSTSKSTKSKGRKQTASISPDPSELELELMSKKDRKKLQNKNAAIRYRMKKKAESDHKRSEEDVLEQINSELKEKVEELAREVGYMKGLIRDVRKARGLPALVNCT